MDNDLDGLIDYEDPDCAPSGTVYFVSNSEGNDDWDGLAPEPDGGGVHGPKQTTEAIASFLNGAGPGDAVLLKRSDSWNVWGTIEIDDAIGDATDPMILGAYGSGAKPKLVKRTSGTLINVRGRYGTASEYFTIENLIVCSDVIAVSPVESSTTTTGLTVQENVPDRSKPHHITIRRCVIENNSKGITLMRNDGDILVEDCQIRNNSIASTTKEDKSWGLYAAADHVTLRGNEFENNGYTGNAFSWCAYVSSRTDVTIESNVFFNAYTGLKVRNMDGAVVRDNTFHDITVIAITVGGDQNGPSRDVIIERNRIYDCGGGLSLKPQDQPVIGGTENVIVRNNLFYQTDNYTAGGHGIVLFSDPVINGFIYNNDFYNLRGGNDLQIRSSSSVTVRNNIFSKLSDTANPALVDTFGADINYNLFQVATTVGLTSGPHAIFGDPELANPEIGDFHLTAASTLAINRGDDAPGIVDDDFDVNPRPNAGKWDIGAFEYVLAKTVGPSDPYSLHIEGSGAGLKITWDGQGMVLQQADTPSGPWHSLPEASSPHVVEHDAPQKFFRLSGSL